MSAPKKLKFIFSPRIKGIKIYDSEEFFPVGKVYCVGKNYNDHAEEMGGMVDKDKPFFFVSHLKKLHKQVTFLFQPKLRISTMK